MGKSLKYVSDFDFPSECGFSGSAGKTMVKGYARGGKVTPCEAGMMKKAAGGAARIKDSLRNEREEISRVKREARSERKDAGQELSRVRREMSYDEQKLKGEAPARRQYPAARREPLIPMMSKGGSMTAKQQAKVGRVMSEYKAGELHSGSKSGPVVKDRKQAVAIAMSEARKKK